MTFKQFRIISTDPYRSSLNQKPEKKINKRAPFLVKDYQTATPI
jgi:hypothetical protein